MRKEFSRKTRRQAWERSNEMCEGTRYRPMPPNSNIVEPYRCNAPLAIGRFEYDHAIPDWMGGDNSLANCVVLCLHCHDEKTARDQGNIAKAKRITDKIIKAKTSRRPMPHGRNSLTKRKIGGAVVPR